MGKKLVKLGPKAETFYDPFSTLKVLKGEVIEINAKAQQSHKVKKAISTGHLTIATEDELKKFLAKSQTSDQKAPKTSTNAVDDSVKEALASKDREIERLKLQLGENEKASEIIEDDFAEGDYADKSDEELVEFYTDNYEVNKTQLKEFKSKSRKERIEYLSTLE